MLTGFGRLSLLCFLVIVGLFLAYATDQLPGAPAPQQVGLQVEDSRNGADEDCSPCLENLARLQKVLQQAEEERLSGTSARAKPDEAVSSTR